MTPRGGKEKGGKRKIMFSNTTIKALNGKKKPGMQRRTIQTRRSLKSLKENNFQHPQSATLLQLQAYSNSIDGPNLSGSRRRTRAYQKTPGEMTKIFRNFDQKLNAIQASFDSDENSTDQCKSRGYHILIESEIFRRHTMGYIDPISMQKCSFDEDSSP